MASNPKEATEQKKDQGPAAPGTAARCEEPLQCDRPRLHDGECANTSGARLSKEELRRLLEAAVPGAEELGRKLKACFRLPDMDYIDSSAAPLTAEQRERLGAAKAEEWGVFPGDIAAIRAALATIDGLADALKALLDNDAIVCVCPPANLEIGGRGHYADCDAAIARNALRKAGRLP